MFGQATNGKVKFTSLDTKRKHGDMVPQAAEPGDDEESDNDAEPLGVEDWTSQNKCYDILNWIDNNIGGPIYLCIDHAYVI